MTNTKTAKILEKVRALLAKADSTTFPEEAETFRAAADRLMTTYAIEQWQVAKAQDGVNARPAPEVRKFNFDWWVTSDRRSELFSLFSNTALHCRCVVAIRAGYESNRDGGFEIPVIGLSSDLDFMDLLFTHLMLQMGKQLEPKPIATVGLDENAYLLRAAGMQRSRAAKLLYDYGLLGPNDIPYSSLTASKEKSMRSRVRVAGERWAKANGLDSTTSVTPTVHQRSFAMGFVREVSNRMSDMRAMRQQRSTGSQELALRDIRQVAQDLYAELYPLSEKKTRGRGRALTREVKVDQRSYQSGKKAGAEAEIATGAAGVGAGRGQLPA